MNYSFGSTARRSRRRVVTRPRPVRNLCSRLADRRRTYRFRSSILRRTREQENINEGGKRRGGILINAEISSDLRSPGVRLSAPIKVHMFVRQDE